MTAFLRCLGDGGRSCRNEDRLDVRLHQSARTERGGSRPGVLTTTRASFLLLACAWVPPQGPAQWCSILALTEGQLALTSPLFLTSLPVHCVFFLSDVDLHLFIPYLTTSPRRLIPLLADCGHPFLTPLPKAKRWRRGLKSWPLRVSWPEPDPPRWNELTVRFTNQRTGGW